MINNEELPDNPLQPVLDQLEAKYGTAASPRDGESDEDWYLRMQTENMLKVTNDAALRDANEARAIKAHEAVGGIVFNEDAVDWYEDGTALTREDDANGETDDARSAAIRALPVHERFREYVKQRKDILAEAVAASEE